MPPREDSEQEKKKKPLLLKEKVFLAGLAGESGVKIVSGNEWALHFKTPRAQREEQMRGLLEGRYQPREVAASLKPDGITYAVEDLKRDGLETTIGRLRDCVDRITHYDYERFAQFIASMKGRSIDFENIRRLYDGITDSRIRRKMLDAYGFTGQKQIEAAMRFDAQQAETRMTHAGRTQKVLEALKIDWMCEDLHLIRTEERDRIMQELSPEEREITEQLKEPYRTYVQHGAEDSYKKLVEQVREAMPTLEAPPLPSPSPDTNGEKHPSESMEQLEKELEPYKDQVGPPGTEKDPAIPPDDRDEYHTPPPQGAQQEESAEQQQSRPIFEIIPSGTSTRPLAPGDYASGRKSYYDMQTKTWSKKKRLTTYTQNLPGDKRWTISGAIAGEIKSLPIPNGYGLDTASLKYTGSRPNIHRDQNGCFYLEPTGTATCSIDFLKEEPPFISPPIQEDTEPLTNAQLSAQTETMLQALTTKTTNNLAKATEAQTYVRRAHFYPGGGDLNDAQALQHKLRTESTGANYIQNLDASEYLECYSANTLFIAMMRKIGIPARLVIGHHVDKIKNGKAVIDQSTGHAWAEVWDGASWRRIDATPPPKPQDKKQNDTQDESGDQQGQGEQAGEPADDGGVEAQNDPAQDTQSKVQQQLDNVKKQQQSGQSQSQEMAEANDQEMQNGEKDLEQAKESLTEMEQKKQEIEKKVNQAKNFKDLDAAQQQAEQEALLEEQKKELEDKIEAKEKEMKDKIKDQLNKMEEEGFIDQQKKEGLLKQLEERKRAQLDELRQEIERQNSLYLEYDEIRREMQPLVEKWYRFFVERLPREKEPEVDEDSRARSGAFDRRSIFRPRNLMFGTIRNPRVIKPSVRPRFMASIMVDVSGSMAGDKLRNARKMLIFYSELFTRIAKEFGYIKFSINIFSDDIKEIKLFEQDYDTRKRYRFAEGETATVKVRLMESLHTAGGTNMLPAIKKAAADLNKERKNYPDFASAFYFMGDGGDTHGNANNIRNFLQINETEKGFGRHMHSAILLGSAAERAALAEIFGEEHTAVAGNFDTLVETSMLQFEKDISNYTRTMVE